MDEEAATRHLVEGQLGKVSDVEWDWLTDLHFHGEEPVWGTPKPEGLAEEMADDYRRALQVIHRIEASPAGTGKRTNSPAIGPQPRGGDPANYPSPPTWWNEKAREVMARKRVMQEAIWQSLGVDGPLALDQVEGFLHQVQELERKAGERLTLVYPDPRSVSGLVLRCEMEVRSGWTLTEMKKAGYQRTWFGKKEQPLARITHEIDVIALETGCSEEDAAAFLLCDAPLRLTWVDFDYVLPGPPVRIAPAITLTVGTPDVPADDVRKAYLYARDRLRSGGGSSDLKLRRRSRDTTWELVAFVEQRRPGMSWTDIFSAWSKDHPKGEKGYHASMESLRATYYKAPMRNRGPS